MTKRYLTTLLVALSLGIGTAQAQESPTIITTQPDGTAYDLYRSTTGFESFYGNAMPHSSHGDWQKIVFANDGTVYLKTPLNSLYTTTWIKGKVANNDTIVFDLPQAFYSEEYNGQTSYGYLCKLVLNEKGTTYVKDENSQQLKYVWRDNTLWLAEGMVSGMCTESGSWTGYGEKESVAKRIDNNNTQPSATAVVNDGLMLYMDLDDASQLYPVKYAIDGNDVYLGNLSQNLKGYWIKGTMKDNVVTFPATSLVGIDTTTVSYVYASAVDVATGHTAYGDEYDSTFVTHEPLVFTYKPSENSLSTRQYLGIHKSSGETEDLLSTDIFDVYRYALINTWTPVAEEPLPPLFTGYMPFDSSYGYAGVEFKLSFYSTKGHYLDPAKLYYCFYVDGNLQSFSPEEYQYITKEMEEVPFSYYDQYDFYKLDENQRRLYFYTEPKEKLGIEALYIDNDGEEPINLSSGVTEYYLNETGIENIFKNEKRVKNIEYTDLAGRRVSRPGKGVYIRTAIMNDGSRQSQKVAY